MHTGPDNSITDVAGILVGNADDPAVRTGVTVVTADRPLIAGVHLMGGAPGTRETELLGPGQTVEAVDALVLSGGSAFGLDACSGVQSVLHAAGRGLAVGPARVPIVPGAILFDLLNGGDKDWGEMPPYRRLGALAAERVSATPPDLGSVGAGYGATIAGLKGGLGSASQQAGGGHMVGVVVAVNAVGAATLGDDPHFWAAPFEIDGEFGGLGLPAGLAARGTAIRTKLRSPRLGENTTIAVVATDAALTKAEASRLAVMAHDGLARALWPCHTPFDGDLVFAASTGRRPLADRPADLMHLGAAAASAMARAIARGVYRAASLPGDIVPAWRARFKAS